MSQPLKFFVPILLLAMAMPRFIIHFLEFLPLRVFQLGGVTNTHPEGASNPSKGRLSLFFLDAPRDRCLPSNLMPPQNLKFNTIESHDLKGNHSKSADIQLYTVNIISIPQQRDTHKHNWIFAFSDMISSMIPTGMRAEGIWSREQRCQTGPNQRWCQSGRKTDGHSVSEGLEVRQEVPRLELSWRCSGLRACGQGH